MVRGPHSTTVAVRGPDGVIVTRSELNSAGLAADVRRVPLLRGIVTLAETLAFGVRSLYWSARVAAGRKDERISGGEVALAAAAMSGAAVVFIAGPVFLTTWMERIGADSLVISATEGVVRIGMLIGYIAFIGRLPEVQRVFAYHGAEHRTIHAWEHGARLDVDSVRAFRNEHPRCGTAFLLTVAAMSLVVFAVLGSPPLIVRIIERLLLTPIIAGTAYEFLRASQAHDESMFFRWMRMPNLWLQKMTTRDPDDDQIEVAIAALNGVIAFDMALPEAVASVSLPVELPVEDRRLD